ncbi:peptidase M18 aminopeptidase I [Dacryopinax primogenitus]|uniref:Peptidase M18 aminopeptidase I n=1 Tax=Dacryopinax primogenitus (strain DJM 731) TaxID=1858805 RepID=M5FPB1_DACPD|nr:peptidase M18 aminopeptidase I [Dacryopinax primogenitus]EJT98395.1 peptidase M18 aminopeptidase I [Dacryopinax primogenitus]
MFPSFMSSSTAVEQERREDDVQSLDESLAPPYAKEFISFINAAPTAYHTCAFFASQLRSAGFIELPERSSWLSIRPGGKYYTTRNSSSIIAFAVGGRYTPPNGIAAIAAHIDALCWKIKPYSKDEKGGFLRLGAAPYSGGGPSTKWDASHSTWWDRDLSLAGRVLVKGKDGKVIQKLVNLGKPIARIPSLAKHFGEPALGPFNFETNMVPIIGMSSEKEDTDIPGVIGKQHSARLLKAIAKELGVSAQDIVDFDLELYDITPSVFLGLDDEFISSPRLDDKLCSFAAISALLASSSDPEFFEQSGTISMVALFDTEEIGSRLRQGAKSNFLQIVAERTVEALGGKGKGPYGQVMANSFMASADVTHSLNPNFSEVYLSTAAPLLNKGIACKVDPNGNTTSNATSMALVRKIGEKYGCEVQLFHIRNDSRSGGTVGPMLSERLGMPCVDIGIPQMSMHSIRGLTGSKDPGLGVKWMEGLFRGFEELSSYVGFE